MARSSASPKQSAHRCPRTPHSRAFGTAASTAEGNPTAEDIAAEPVCGHEGGSSFGGGGQRGGGTLATEGSGSGSGGAGRGTELAVALSATVGNGSALRGAARGTAEAAPCGSLLSAMQRSQPHTRHHCLSAQHGNVHADLVGWDPGRESWDHSVPLGGPNDMAHALGARPH